MKIVIALAAVSLVTILVSQNQGPARTRNEIVLERTNDGDFPTKQFPPLVLPGGRLLITVADTIYALTPAGELLWKHSTSGETLTALPAFNPEVNEIAIVGYDLLFERLDAKTGKVKWKGNSAGRAVFVQVAAYRKGFLVVLSMDGYRENDKLSGVRTRTPDQLEFWTNCDADYWQMDFPVDAELVVAGDEIYSIRHGKDKVRIDPIRSPRPKRPGATDGPT